MSNTATINLDDNDLVTPVADAGMAQSVLSEASVTLQGLNSGFIHTDATLTYAWMQTDSTGTTVSLSGDSTTGMRSFVAPTVIEDTIVLTFSLTVTAARGGALPTTAASSTPAVVAITVSAFNNAVNNAPTATGTIAPLSLAVGSATGTRNVVSNFTDADGDTLIYSTASGTESVATVMVSSAGVVTVTPVSAGTSEITVTVRDGNNGTATQRFTVTVNAVDFEVVHEEILPVMTAIVAAQAVASVAKRVAVAPVSVVAAESIAGSGYIKVGGHSSFTSLVQNQAQSLQARRALSFRDLLEQSEFSLSLRRRNASEPGACLNCFITIWGAADYRQIKGFAGADISFDGELLTGQIGVETGLSKNVLAGASISFSDGQFNYSQNSNSGEYKLRLNSINPYIGAYLLDNKLDLWATVGYGTGDVTIDANNTSVTSGLELFNVGAGATGRLLSFGCQKLSLKAELSKSIIKVDDTASISAFEVDVSRIRALLELSRSQYGSTALMDLSIASGVRYEDTDSDNNFAVEITGSAKVTIKTDNLKQPALSLQLNGSFLKGQNDYEEWGVQGLIQLKIRHQTGLSFSLVPGYGTAKTALDNIWTEAGHSQTTYQQQPRMQLKTRLDYRLKFHGFITPYTEMDFQDAASIYVIGIRWQPTHRLNLDLSAKQLTRASRRADQAVLLKTQMAF